MNLSTVKDTDKSWFRNTDSRRDSFTGSFLSRSELGTSRKSMLNPRLLEMVIKTINKRPSIAGEFQRGLAKTATKTWNTHLAQRKKMTKKQKVVEGIASNLGLAKGFRTEFQDEAERLVSILFKEIGKKKAKEEEISSDESTPEEESDHSIQSFKEIPEPVQEPKPPPKPPSVRKIPVQRPLVKAHSFHAPYITASKKIEKVVEETPTEKPKLSPIQRRLGLSFINVTKIHMHSNTNLKDVSMPGRKSIERTYVEIRKSITDLKDRFPREPLKKKILKKDIPERKDSSEKKDDSSEKKSDKTPKVHEEPKKGQESDLLTLIKVKGYEDGKKQLVSGLQPTAESVRKTYVRTTLEDMYQEEYKSTNESRRISQSPTKSRQSKKKQKESIEDQIDEKTKDYVIQQIKEMLNTLTCAKKNSELELVKQKKRERKSIFVLWKNYFDVRNLENIAAESVGYKKMERESLLKEVEIEMMKADIFRKLASFLGTKNWRAPYEETQWNYLNEKANAIDEDKERLNDKILEHTIQILEEQLKKSETPKEVLLEEERRRKALEDHMARLNSTKEKYSAKRPNTKETTMEEILQMRVRGVEHCTLRGVNQT